MGTLDGLNPEQKMAVEHIDGPLLVVAGAGTGKTQVITRRIAHLIEQGKAKPAQVLALTFTEKAAREMEERLYGLIGWQSFQVAVMTFHAFGTELLSRYASHVGRSIRGGLLNDTQKALLLRQHIGRVELNYYGPQADMFEFLEGIVGYIGQLQNAAVGVDDYDGYVDNIRHNPGEMHPRDVDEQADLAKLYRLYEDIKVETGTFDHNDQLDLPLRILQERPNLAVRLAQQYRYVLVDEYQDTNAVQDALIRTFISPDGNLFAVGDDDQAIYGFRGAEIGNILAFAEHFRLDRPVVLIRNYRSGQAVLDSAYRLIRHNDPERLESRLGINKQLIGQHDQSTVRYEPYLSPADEQDAVLTQIARRLESGEAPGSIAVLAATHAPLKALSKAMRVRGIPYALSTSVNIFEQPELIGLWYLLRWLCFQASEEAIGHVIMGPFIGWSADQYRQLLESARDEDITIDEALIKSEHDYARELVQTLQQWRQWAQEVSVGRLAFQLVFETGRATAWRGQVADMPRMIRVFEDLQRLFDQMQDYESVALNTTLSSYMEAFPKPPTLEVSEPSGDSDGVQLLTVHASKGLEFETVYLVNCNQRSWSGVRTPLRAVPPVLQRSHDLPPEHEFRRLMYVAVTRARKELIISSAVQTAGGSKQAASGFITEIFGPEVLKQLPAGRLADRLENVLGKLQQYHPMQQITEVDRLPFESHDGWLDIGVTALGGYEYCPFEFYLQQVLQIRQPLGPQLAFGNALHKTFETYYRSHLGGQVENRSALHGLLDELWSDRGYEHKSAAEKDRLLAHKTLDTFIDREENQTERAIIGSEVPIRFELPEAKLRLRGKIDALFEVADGVELRDFKTGRTKTNAEKLSKDAKDNFQLRTYALAYEALNGTPPAEVTLDYVVTGTEGTGKLSPTILRNHRNKLITLADQIRQRQFAPNTSAMHQCAAIKYYGTGEQDALIEAALADSEGEA